MVQPCFNITHRDNREAGKIMAKSLEKDVCRSFLSADDHMPPAFPTRQLSSTVYGTNSIRGARRTTKRPRR